MSDSRKDATTDTLSSGSTVPDVTAPDASATGAAGVDLPAASVEDGATAEMLASLFAYMAMISLTAVGGGVIMVAPDMHRYLVDVRQWITGPEFAAAFTIARAAPGPNVLFVTLIGLRIGGVVGAVTATLGILLLPFLLALAYVRWMPQRPAGPFGRAFRNGLASISIGLLAAGGVVLARAADTGTVTLLMTVAATAAIVLTRWNPVWLMAAGAVCGVVLGL